MRICHVCSGHTVDDGRVFHRACTTLAAAGYDVHLLATGAGGEPYRENGVTIHPLPKPGSRTDRLRRRYAVARQAARLSPALFHVHEPELLGPVVACAGSRPVIWDVHEAYLEVLGDRAWIPAWARAGIRTAWDWRERQLLRACAAVIPATEGIARRYRPLHPHVQVVLNCPDLETIETAPAVEKNPHSCIFAGLLAPNRGLSESLKALGILKHRGCEVRLSLAGRPITETYLRDLWEEADRLGVREQVTYHGLVSKQEVLVLERQAAIGLVPHLPYGNNLTAIPVKMMEFMAMGLPLVYSDLPVHAEIAGRSGAGIAVDPRCPEQIAAAIERLLEEPETARRMGKAGEQAARVRFNWGVEQVNLVELYRKLL